MRTSIVGLAFCFTIAFSQYSLKTEHLGGANECERIQHIPHDSNEERHTGYNGGTETLPFDVPFPSVHINETTGTFVLNFPFDGFVEIYNAEGTKQWEEHFFKEMSPNYERTITVALGMNSIAFLTSDVRLPNALVHRYVLNGRKDWETALPHSMGYEIAMSKDERTVVAGSYFVLEDEVRRAATVLNNEGTVTGTADILFRNAAFSDDGTLIALASEREVSLYSLALRKETARISTAKKERIITGIIWERGELVVQETTVKTTTDHQYYYTDPTFIRLNTALKEQSRRTIDNLQFKRSTLSIGQNGLLFRPDTGESILLR
jgi:hypothetical protein